MKKVEKECWTISHELVLLLADLIYEKNLISESSMFKIVEGTENFTMEQRTMFYKKVIRLRQVASRNAICLFL